MMNRTSAGTRFGASIVAVFVLVVCTATLQQTNWYTQIKNGMVIDPRTFGAVCDGNTANAGADTTGIQLALDAVQYSNGGAGGFGAPYTGQVPTIVHMVPGQCSINAPLVIHKPNVILEGSGVSADSSMKNGTWLNAVSGFNGPMIRTSSEDIYNYPSAGQGQNTPVVRGVQFRNFGMDITAATASSSFLSHWALEAFSPSDNPDFINNIWVLGQRGGCFLISTSLSSSANNIMYDPEQTAIRNFMCFTNGNLPTQAGIQIIGSNEITVDTGSISIGNAGFVTPSGTHDNNNAAGVEVASDTVGNFSNHVNIKNVHVTDYAVHFRVKGADQTLVPFGGGCFTHPGCANGSPQHYGPAWVHFTNNECESYHICLAVRPEGNPNAFSPNRPSLEVTWDRTNTLYFPNAGFQSTAQVAYADFLAGGEIDNGYRTSVLDSPQAPVFLDTNTVGVTSWQYYNVLISGWLPVVSLGHNFIQMAIDQTTFAQLPRCFQTTCSVPSTDAPVGVTLRCSDCAGIAGGVVTGGSFGRSVISNGGAWVGQ